MTNVIDINSKAKKQDKPTIEPSAEENYIEMLFAFGVESTFIKVENLDDDSVRPVYGADFKIADTEGVLVCIDALESALFVWGECYRGRFFDSHLSALIQFISCVTESILAKEIVFTSFGGGDEPASED